MDKKEVCDLCDTANKETISHWIEQNIKYHVKEKGKKYVP